MTKTLPWFALVLLLMAAPASAELSRDELKEALKEHPDVLLEVLREHRAELLDIVSSAAQDARMEEAKRQQEAERQEMENSFANPFEPEVVDSTRVRGNDGAAITVVEYSDFQCPYCQRGFQTVQSLREKYGEELRFVYKHLPLPIHPEAMPAAQFMEAISMQSEEKAWLFHDAIFEDQRQLGREFYVETARELGVDVEQMLKDAESDEVAERIEADMKEAQSFDISGTPGFLVNGVPLRGAYPITRFDEIITRLKSEQDPTGEE